MKKICFLVNTEYHLLFTLFLLDDFKKRNENVDATIILHKEKNSVRLNQEINFKGFNCKVIYLEYNVFEKTDIKTIKKIKFINLLMPDEFYFFQEKNLFAHELIAKYKKRNCCVYLCQDGFKPYAIHTLRFSPITHYFNFFENVRLLRMGKKPNNFFSFLFCHKYAYVKGIDKLMLSFEKSYINWNKKPIVKTNPKIDEIFMEKMKIVFGWQDILLPEKENVIFYINQPMGDKKGDFDLHLIRELKKLHPGKIIYIKNHPQIDKERIKAYKTIDNVYIINSKIPAELFIAHLKHSVIISFFSTALFIENSTCKFYYLFGIKNTGLKFLKSYNLSNPTSHVKVVNHISQILF